ncbi:MAG: hypothetical protein P1U68_13840 [Verrucomicrobiales bacterium]|nr:hypothetical protein [Verrucomicrobiales bacterium]
MDEPSWLEKTRGYIDLGMFDEAWKAIEALPAELSGSPEAQEMRIIIMLDRKEYDDGLALSEVLCDIYPENHAGFIQGAYCLHAMGRTQEAIDHLQTGPETLRDEQCYFYNIACYELALGRTEAALTWLNQSIGLDPRNRTRALKDPDLEPLHDEVRRKGK